MKEYNDHIVSSFDDDIASIRRSIIKMAILIIDLLIDAISSSKEDTI